MWWPYATTLSCCQYIYIYIYIYILHGCILETVLVWLGCICLCNWKYIFIQLSKDVGFNMINEELEIHSGVFGLSPWLSATCSSCHSLELEQTDNFRHWLELLLPEILGLFERMLWGWGWVSPTVSSSHHDCMPLPGSSCSLGLQRTDTWNWKPYR